MRCIPHPQELTGLQKYILDKVLIDACSDRVTVRLHPNYRHQCGLGKLSFTSTERLIPGFSAPTHLVTKDSKIRFRLAV
jgi:hypothetical protein